MINEDKREAVLEALGIIVKMAEEKKRPIPESFDTAFELQQSEVNRGYNLALIDISTELKEAINKLTKEPDVEYNLWAGSIKPEPIVLPYETTEFPGGSTGCRAGGYRPIFI
jgi:hypothetical protein